MAGRPRHRPGLRRLVCALLVAASPLALAATGRAALDPDQMLINVYKDLGARHLRDALASSDRLVAAYPNFQLGHLIRGDLLLMQTHEVDRFGAVDGARPLWCPVAAPAPAPRRRRCRTCARKRWRG
jgi:hypothetical protein